ncbi:undecaprenyldiphospho-muramoylpentapeptide beta-N-acetylglucosaminyltransferase [Afifella sp. IM 167]|uniref:undecaprenyldiphospho-muramoylpentapeptide beta-N-acetylglucosaminyltransferase n=1 Tax=Afifella sp. IM 167 TaxID=2033586 RepID=UPI001CC9D4D8|nr:undecaprenyldiphospho-muramoylpentapeptide beta-N-acetylglucosaminyltransferase [Afifella sp. IM 167]MBZ8135192.1 undecaprenyldiphospho-muramoylpentapeptide beta-N-acetylglucosaminyltransferase [Afifella sp. IM 167]
MSGGSGKTALLAAGGTGGHLFPALSLREALLKRGWRVAIATDKRAGAYISGVPAEDFSAIEAATITAGNPLKAAISVMKLGRGVLQSRKIISRLKADIVVGFGGYPTVPPLVAARSLGVAALVHEQNAVLGRANRFLLKAGAALATGFPDPKGAEAAKKVVFTGNPVRAMVLAAAERPYEPLGSEGKFHLLVFGGSQGARVFSELVPQAVRLMPEELRARLDLVQQCRPEDLEAARADYAAAGITPDLEPFFGDLPGRIAAAHLVISRAGASTVSELAVIGRPAILVPLPHALDQDQAANARLLDDIGGGWLMEQKTLTPEKLASTLADLIARPDRLAEAAAAARKAGRPDGAERLADAVEALSERGIQS